MNNPGRSYKYQNMKFRSKNGYYAHHGPDGFLHDFVPTGRKATDPRVSTRKRT